MYAHVRSQDREAKTWNNSKEEVAAAWNLLFYEIKGSFTPGNFNLPGAKLRFHFEDQVGWIYFEGLGKNPATFRLFMHLNL